MNRKVIVTLIASALVLILAGAGIAVGLSQNAETPVEAKAMSVQVKCDGWNESTSTPIVVSVFKDDVKAALTSTDANATAPTALETIQVKAGEKSEFKSITEDGKYTIYVMGSPVLEDGTIFNIPEPQVIDFKVANGNEIQIELTKKDASQVTEADIAAATAAATAVGADTTKVTNNTNSTRNTASSAQGGTINQGSTNAATNTVVNNGGGSTTPAQPSQPSQPAHEHTWVAQTTQVWHEPVTQTVNHAAVYDSVIVCDVCGAQGIGEEHSYNHMINGEGSNTHVATVLVTPAYSETVTVSDGYYETVTTGYVCSGCGATK